MWDFKRVLNTLITMMIHGNYSSPRSPFVSVQKAFMKRSILSKVKNRWTQRSQPQPLRHRPTLNLNLKIITITVREKKKSVWTLWNFVTSWFFCFWQMPCLHKMGQVWQSFFLFFCLKKTTWPNYETFSLILVLSRMFWAEEKGVRMTCWCCGTSYEEMMLTCPSIHCYG